MPKCCGASNISFRTPGGRREIAALPTSNPQSNARAEVAAAAAAPPRVGHRRRAPSEPAPARTRGAYGLVVSCASPASAGMRLTLAAARRQTRAHVRKPRPAPVAAHSPLSGESRPLGCAGPAARGEDGGEDGGEGGHRRTSRPRAHLAVCPTSWCGAPTGRVSLAPCPSTTLPLGPKPHWPPHGGRCILAKIHAPRLSTSRVCGTPPRSRSSRRCGASPSPRAAALRSPVCAAVTWAPPRPS